MKQRYGPMVLLQRDEILYKSSLRVVMLHLHYLVKNSMKITSSLEIDYNKSTIPYSWWVNFSTPIYFTTSNTTDDYSYVSSSRTPLVFDIWDYIACIVLNYDSTNTYISIRSTLLPKNWGAIVTNYYWDIRDSDGISSVRYNNWVLYINHTRPNPEYITYDILANTYTQFNSWTYSWWVVASNTAVELWSKKYSAASASYIKTSVNYVKYFVKAENI